MLAAQCVPHSYGVRLRAVATPRVSAATLRKSCVVHGKVTAAQLREREAVQTRESTLGTPVVDYLLETSPYARFLDDEAVASIRDREKTLKNANISEKLRRLRIAFANKGRKPWNAGKHHDTATIEKIRKGVARAMQDPAVIDKLRKNYVAQTPETRIKMKERIKLRYGVQLHKTAFGHRSKNCNSVATTGAAVFHCHIGCSALVGFRRVGWRRNTVFDKRRTPRKVRRKMTEEELEASRERARHRVAEAMKKKWRDPEYRAKQTEAIRTSHVENPRARAPSTRTRQSRRSSKPRRAQQSTLSKRLANQTRELQSTLQELQETRAYHAKFEGVVSKLQAQVEALSTQPEAQLQVQQALAGVWASQEKAHGSITALENKALKLQQQVESTQLALDKEQAQAAESSEHAGATCRGAGTGQAHAVNSDGSELRRADPTAAEPAGASDEAGTVPVSERTLGHTVATDGPAAPGLAGAAEQRAGLSHDGSGSNGTRSTTRSPAAPSSMVAEQAVANSNGAAQHGAIAEVGPDSALNGAASGSSEDVLSKRLPFGHTSSDHVSANGNGFGVHETGADSQHGRVRPRMGGGGGSLRDEVEFGAVAGIAGGGAALSIPTAAEWKDKMFDTSHNGHVLTDAFPTVSSVGCADESPSTAAATAGTALVTPPQAGTRVAHRVEYDTPEEGMHPGAGASRSAGSQSLSQQDADSDESQGEGDSLNWLQKRAHKLPWQE